jgi:hypothetical protein
MRPRLLLTVLVTLVASLAPARAYAVDARTCYVLTQAHAADTFDPVRHLPFADAFGAGTVNVTRPKVLCAPAAIEGAPIAEPQTFLESYEVRGRDDQPLGPYRQDVAVVDRFGTLTLDVGIIDRFMTPTAFDALTPLPGLPATALGPFTCRRASVTSSMGRLTLVVADVFRHGDLRVLEPTRLCSGTDGGTPAFLTCYAARTVPAVRPLRNVHTRTVFGPERLDRGRARELCVPATLGGQPPPSTTSTTARPTTTTTSTSTTTRPSTSTTVVTTTTSTSTTTRPPDGTLRVPADYPTIQAAVNAAGPGATSLVASGDYVERVLVTGARDGLTIAGADPADPPTIVGTPNRSLDGIRVDDVDGVSVRHLRIVGTYDAVRLNGVHGATLADLYLEDSALAIRVNGGAANTIARVTIVGTRVEQGIEMVAAPGSAIVDTSVSGSYREGIRVVGSDDVRVQRNRVMGARSDGMEIGDGARLVVRDNVVRDSYNHGIRLDDVDGLDLANNTSSDNRGAGLRLEKASPFATVAQVLATGFTGGGNGQADVVVLP